MNDTCFTPFKAPASPGRSEAQHSLKSLSHVGTTGGRPGPVPVYDTPQPPPPPQSIDR